MHRPLARLRSASLLAMLWLALLGNCLAQIDPYHRNLLQLGYDQTLSGDGPRGLYAFYYYNNPEIHGTNTALRLAIAPAYLDREIGFRQLLSSTTDVGLAFTPKSQKFRIIARYGYGFNAFRADGRQGAHSVGLLFQYDFGSRLNGPHGS